MREVRLGSPREGPSSNETTLEANWGLSFQQEGEPPVANATADYLKQYNAYYAQDTE